jgi:YidC/Oxa1 family membrane protein insertase
MNFFQTLLWPLKWLIEAVLVGFHTFLTALGFDPTSGLAWILSIAGLVICVRLLLVPLFLKTMKISRKMGAIAPELKAIQQKYEGQRGPEVEKAKSDELIALYKTTGSHPFAAFGPILLQLPIFLSLFAVMQNASNANSAGVGLLNKTLSNQFYNAEIYGATLHDNFMGALDSGNTSILLIIPILLAIQLGAQTLSLFWSVSAQVKNDGKQNFSSKFQIGTLAWTSVLFIGVALGFPLALLFYMVTSSIWSTGQQFVYTKYAQRKAHNNARIQTLESEIEELDREAAREEYFETHGEYEKEPDDANTDADVEENSKKESLTKAVE